MSFEMNECEQSGELTRVTVQNLNVKKLKFRTILKHFAPLKMNVLRSSTRKVLYEIIKPDTNDL